jgi:hypothetical protein
VEEADEGAIEAAAMLSTMISGGDTIEGAVRRLQRFVPASLLEEGRRIYEVRVGRIRDLKNPGALVAKERKYGYWYDGPKAADSFWPPVKHQLIDAIGEGPVQDVDDSSSKILGLMRPPGADSINTRGLVLGYVQSGKTTSFMSVAAKSVDVGYRLIVVLSGITDNLRSQTQERLEDVLVGDLREKWYLLTDLDEDFVDRGNAANLLGRSDHRLLAVVKKNPYRLRRLLHWLESAGESTMRHCPILIIDDEADQASIDVGSRGRTSRINGLIKQLLNRPKAGYVAYTATPFANLLLNASDYEDLYPRDFIVDLPRPDTYFGPERLFGRDPITPDEDAEGLTDGLDVIRYVDANEIRMVQPPRGRGAVQSWEPEISPSLARAMDWFLLATAARGVRGVGTQHSSMLIHTTMLSEGHERMRGPIQDRLEQLRNSVSSQDAVTIESLKSLWDSEIERVDAQDDSSRPVSWQEVWAAIPKVLADVRVVIDNYRSTERLTYFRDDPQTVIVIGGNTLSRGLTLEGLVCSYFVRAASAYDTLLQMGRWFGYRRGYGDLVRIWMTPELETWFFDLGTVEEEIRRDIRRYEDEGLDPSEVAVRIRRHPAMAITSAAKMRHAVKAEVSYGGSRQQTILFEHLNADWLRTNWNAGVALVQRARSVGRCEPGAIQGRSVIRDVPYSEILRFIAGYNFHPRAFQMRRDLIEQYVRSQVNQGSLKSWNIVIMGHPTTENGYADLGLGRSVNLIVRSKMDMPGISHANIKSLVSTIDRIADQPYTRQEIQSMLGRDISDSALLDLREELVGPVGLLCLYPISKASAPRKQKPNAERKRRRLALDAAADVLGVGFFFPESRGLTGGVSYVSADLSDMGVEEEDFDIDALDAADEAIGEATELGAQ